MAQARVRLIGSDDAEEYIDRLAHKLNEHPDLWLPYQSIDDVLQKVRDGDYQLWTGGFGDDILIWGLTELRIHSRVRTVTIIWCSGEHGPEFYAAWISALENFAALMQIERIVIETGRLGWQRIFEPHGFRLSAIELVKDLKHEQQAAIECNAD